MLDAARHRGPDGLGIAGGANVLFGHRRLAILDLSSAAAQPMTRGDCCLTFNGEIYNYVELRMQLTRLGHGFTTDSDTEVLLASYLEWGQSCVERFDGMWAFAIHDARSNSIFFSRDRFGEKPLVYSLSRDRLVFASEPKQLRAIGIGRSADSESVLRYLALDLKAQRKSFYQGIQELPPGTNVVLDLKTFSWQAQNYYQPSSSAYAGIHSCDIQDALEFELQQSIDRRLRSDVKVGILLSGGVDSSILGSVAGPQYLASTGQSMVAITSSTGDPANDESQYAQSVADSCGLEWVHVDTGETATQSTWAEATVAQDQPLRSTSVVAQFNTMRAAKATGVTVLLNGQGADETWLGYHKYVVLAAQSLPPRSRWSFLKLASSNFGVPVGKMLALGVYFRASRLAALRNWYVLRRVGIEASYPEILREFDVYNSSNFDTEEFRRREIMDRGFQQLLQHEDRNSMAFSLESRLPFLSPGLVDLALSIPPLELYTRGWSKWPLRVQLSPHVEHSVAWRRSKVGFDGHSAAFDRADPPVLAEIASSRILRELGMKPAQLSHASSRVMWRLFSVVLWEENCDVTPP